MAWSDAARRAAALARHRRTNVNTAVTKADHVRVPGRTTITTHTDVAGAQSYKKMMIAALRKRGYKNTKSFTGNSTFKNKAGREVIVGNDNNKVSVHTTYWEKGVDKKLAKFAASISNSLATNNKFWSIK